MLRDFIQRVLGRTRARAEPHAADLESLIVDLTLLLDDELRSALQPEFTAARTGGWRDRSAAAATLFCRIEERLAERADDSRAFRAQFRERVARQWPRLAAASEFELVLVPPEAQEEAICRSFLNRVVDGVHGALGSAGGDRIGAMRRWLQEGGAAPFGDDDNAPVDGLTALQYGSRAFHGWLEPVLGRRADEVYEQAYRRTATRFEAVDAFPAVLGMLPERLLTADKLSLLRRGDIERMLRKKVAELERANADIRRTRDTLEERVRQRTSDLEIAREQAVAANRAKSDFLATVSHELRTPLNAVLGFSQMMMDPHFQRQFDSRRYAEYARHIHESGAHLLAIVNAILDTAKVESGKHELHEQNVQIAEVIESSLVTTTPRLREAGLVLHRRVGGDLPDVIADRRILIQMLLNLLSNAIKFTPVGGSVHVEAGLNELGGIDLTVRDTGVGIAEDDIPVVLEPFRQARNARNAYVRDESGTGLGLPLVKGMAELHGGELILRSTVGVGTSAIIRLPPSRVQRRPEPNAGAAG